MVYTPVRQDRNELVLAVSEVGGGWGSFVGSRTTRKSELAQVTG
jgi:hypothetical protein